MAALFRAQIAGGKAIYGPNIGTGSVPASGQVMPVLVGVDWQQAIATLIQAGVCPNDGRLPTDNYVKLKFFDVWPVSIVWQKAPGIVSGWVTAQSPAVGTSAPLNTPVTLTVASFPMPVSDRYTAGAYS